MAVKMVAKSVGNWVLWALKMVVWTGAMMAATRDAQMAVKTVV